MRKVKENIEMGGKNSNDKGVPPHLIQTACAAFYEDIKNF